MARVREIRRQPLVAWLRTVQVAVATSPFTEGSNDERANRHESRRHEQSSCKGEGREAGQSRARTEQCLGARWMLLCRSERRQRGQSAVRQSDRMCRSRCCCAAATTVVNGGRRQAQNQTLAAVAAGDGAVSARGVGAAHVQTQGSEETVVMRALAGEGVVAASSCRGDAGA